MKSLVQVCGAALLMAEAAVAQAPAALVSSRIEALGAIVAGTRIATQKPALPADAAQLKVLTCAYAGGHTRHYWHGAAPSWLAAIPAGHPLNQLVGGADTQCPAVLRDPGRANVSSGAAVVAPPVETGPAPATERAQIPLPSFELGRKDFKATGLEFEQAFTHLYVGDFRRMPFERDRPEMTAMMGTYIEVFGKGCREFLPRNAVPVMEQVCISQYVSSGQCADWKERETGYLADPGVYGAYRGLGRLAATKAFGEVLAMMQGGLSGLADKVQVVRSMNSDVAELIRMNGCGSRALRRFQDNMRLYATNEQPVVIRGDGGRTPPAPPEGAPARPPMPEQNFSRMLDDLVDASSRSWALNRYHSGSMTDVRVASRDAQGRPRRVTGRYSYEGLTGRATGTVALEFSSGTPQCLYFWDFPTACRTPDRAVSTAYADGNYATRE